MPRPLKSPPLARPRGAPRRRVDGLARRSDTDRMSENEDGAQPTQRPDAANADRKPKPLTPEQIRANKPPGSPRTIMKKGIG